VLRVARTLVIPIPKNPIPENRIWSFPIPGIRISWHSVIAALRLARTLDIPDTQNTGLGTLIPESEPRTPESRRARQRFSTTFHLRALPTETKVESGTSQSQSGKSSKLSNTGISEIRNAESRHPNPKPGIRDTERWRSGVATLRVARTLVIPETRHPKTESWHCNVAALQIARTLAIPGTQNPKTRYPNLGTPRENKSRHSLEARTRDPKCDITHRGCGP